MEEYLTFNSKRSIKTLESLWGWESECREEKTKWKVEAEAINNIYLRRGLCCLILQPLVTGGY